MNPWLFKPFSCGKIMQGKGFERLDYNNRIIKK